MDSSIARPTARSSTLVSPAAFASWAAVISPTCPNRQAKPRDCRAPEAPSETPPTEHSRQAPKQTIDKPDLGVCDRRLDRGSVFICTPRICRNIVPCWWWTGGRRAILRLLAWDELLLAGGTSNGPGRTSSASYQR